MEKFFSVCHYLLDFKKVRSFQEMCGLEEVQHSSSSLAGSVGENKLEQGKTETSQTHNVNYKVNNLFLYYLFRFGSVLGTEEFYILFLPFVFWNIDPSVGRKMIVVWMVTMLVFNKVLVVLQFF